MSRTLCTKILYAGSLLLLLASCNAGSYGFAPWPIYSQDDHRFPKKPVALTAESFTPEEQAILKALSQDHPELFKKLQGQARAYEKYGDALLALIQQHNIKAKENNLKGLEQMGHTKESLEKLLE